MSDNPKFTPGQEKWEYNPRFKSIDCGERPIANMVETFNGGEALAKRGSLIAAAPELYEACRTMYEVFNTENEKELEGYFRKPFLKMKQALAKAEGR